MSWAEKKELRCKIDTCIWHEQYIWSNKKAITQSSVVADRYEMLRLITKYVFCKVCYSFTVANSISPVEFYNSAICIKCSEKLDLQKLFWQ